MFFSRNKGDQYELQRYMRRICDLTSPNLPRQDDFRGEKRYNRTLPVLLAPYEGGCPVLGDAVTALTKDISDQGLCVMTPQPFRCEEAVIGFWLPKVQDNQPWFFRCNVRPNVPIGGGFWALGLEAVEFLSVTRDSELSRLLPLIQRLLPPTELATSSPSSLVRE